MLCSYLYYIIFLQLIQSLFCPSSITCVNSMDASYIPVAKARGFTTHWIKNSGGFMMPQIVNTPILISVPNVKMQVWNNAVFSRNSKGLPCMTAGLPTGIIRIFSMQSAVPIFSVN